MVKSTRPEAGVSSRWWRRREELRLDLREEVVLVRPLCTLGWQAEGLIDHDDAGVSVANIQAHCASSIRQAVTHAS